MSRGVLLLELHSVLQKLHAVIDEDGVLAFSVKKGSGDELSSAKVDAPRYFQYWEIEPLQESLEESAFEIESYDIILEEGRGIEWLQVIARPQ